MSRFKTFATNLGLVVFAVVIILGALEAALAITQFNTPATLRFIPDKGVTYIPHAYYRNTKEGFSEGYFNSHGFRDYERTYEKPAGVFRILVLGDSYIEALQVQLDDSFPALLEKTLNAHGSITRFEVLALGQSGFGTADEYLRYLNFGIAYDPDLVVLAFLTGNDFRNNSKFLDRERVGFYYTFDHSHNLVLDRSLVDAYENNLSYPKRLFEELKTKSHLLSLISERVYLFRRQLLDTRMEDAPADKESAGDDKRKGLDLFSDLNIYRSDLAPPWKETIEITKEIILTFKKSVEEHGSRFLLLGLSNAEQVHPEVGNTLKNQYKIGLDYEQPDRILEEVAIENGVLFLKLMPAFRDYHVKTGRYLHGFGSSHAGHWNQEGHRMAAELTFQFLKERHLVPLESRDIVKILVVHSELGVLRGGGENFTRNLFLAFAERGHDVSAAFIADSNGRYPIVLPAKILPIPLAGRWSRKFGQEALSSVARCIPQGKHLRARWNRLQEAICWRTVRWHDRRFTRRIELEFGGRWKRFDAVYVHGNAVLASRIARYCPTVLRLPGPVSAELAPVLKAVHAVCANGDVLSQIRRFLGDYAVELPVGLDGDVFKPGPTQVRARLAWTKDHWVIGYVGRLAYIKGVDLLAGAFVQLRRSIPHARLLIVGSGEEKGKLYSRLRSELAEGIVHIESDVPHDLLVEWYRAMDLFVMPSRYENCSNALLESMACGVPFLASDVGGNRHFAEAMGGGLFARSSADSLAQSLHAIAQDPCQAKERATFGGEKVRHLYSWASSAGRLEHIFELCLASTAGATCRP